MRLATTLASAALAFLAAAAPPGAGAQVPPPPLPAPPKPVPARTGDQVDYLFLASDRPVLLRLHVRVGNKPYSAAFDAWLAKLFDWFDKDRDGSLSPAEAARLVPGNILVSQIQGSIGLQGGPPAFALLDTNKDGKVSREEFRAYYARNGLQPLGFSYNPTPATAAKGVNDAIYKQLGLRPSGKLTAGKLAGLEGLLRKLDENEDELLSAQELRQESANNNFYGFAVPLSTMGMSATADAGLIEVLPNQQTVYAQRVMRRYDKNRDGKLTREEVRFPRALFDRLDANKDGVLDAKELSAFFALQPDLVLAARVGKVESIVSGAIRFAFSLGKRPAAAPRAEVRPQGRLPATAVKRLSGDALAFDLGDAHIDLKVNQGGGGNNNRAGIKNFYGRQFDMLAEKKGYVDRAQEKENRNTQGRFLFLLFAQADRNADGKLTKKELNAYLDLQAEGGACAVNVSMTDTGRNLFDVLDANRDGQLSVREMRTAWQRVKPHCKDGKALAQNDLPRMLRLELEQGTNFNPLAAPVVFGGGPAATARANTGPVPVWFTKLDRNGDGDLSPKEWLGADEEFRRIDADGDGLISAEEARQYEARRKKPEKKPDPAKKK
jgi:Ca2+-binding EF-hand superfamily protein